MNKQEIEKAIEYFRAGNFLGKSMDKHINVAISVLEQQLNGGWIPDIMKEVLGEEITDIILSNPDEFKKWLERGIWNCKRLNELSNCKNGWIPVSERLPEEGRYLVTTVYGEVKESKFDLEKWWQIDNSTISLAWEEEPIKVVAWQPLPPKYEEVSG